jgi:hypothetical protein
MRLVHGTMHSGNQAKFIFINNPYLMLSVQGFLTNFRRSIKLTTVISNNLSEARERGIPR